MSEFCKIHNHPFGVKEYSYSIFSQEEMRDIVNHLETEYYSNPEMCDSERPGRQTIQCLFDDPKFHTISRSFVESVRDYTNQPEIVSMIDLNKDYNCRSWCYVNWLSEDNNEPGIWHVHNDVNYPQAISGIFYLKLPKSPGGETKFHVGGNLFDLPSNEWSWFIFPSSHTHCPGDVTSSEKRYVISADLWFYPDKNLPYLLNYL